VLQAVQPADVRETTDYIGTLRALRSTTIQPQVAGHVTRIFVASGDRVGAGAPLVQIDPDRQQAAVDTVEAALAARQADVDLARQNLGRLRSLLAERVVSQAEVDQAEAALKTSEAGLDASRAQLREGRVQLRYFQVVAPTAGTVGDVPIRVGDRVTTDTMLTTIDSIDRLELNVQVPSQRAASLRPGLVVQVLGDDGEPLVDTEATFISPRVDEATQSVLVKTVFANPGTLRANQFVRARLVWATKPGLLVPVLAVLRLNGQPFVFVAEDTNGRLVARQRPVTLGPISCDAYSVFAGLEAGQRVIVSGVQRLGDGVPIAVAPGA
jgi:RND family efflux transporter MFP subunit